jgi:hypothetical protein
VFVGVVIIFVSLVHVLFFAIVRLSNDLYIVIAIIAVFFFIIVAIIRVNNNLNILLPSSRFIRNIMVFVIVSDRLKGLPFRNWKDCFEVSNRNSANLSQFLSLTSKRLSPRGNGETFQTVTNIIVVFIIFVPAIVVDFILCSFVRASSYFICDVISRIINN